MAKTVVSIVRCESYERKHLRKALEETLRLLGRDVQEDILKPGKNILLKPNMLSSRPPEEGVNTNVNFLKEVAEVVKEIGASPSIGDSPGGGNVDAKTSSEKCGFAKVARESTGRAFVIFEKEKQTKLEIKNGVIYDNVCVSETVLQSHAVLSLPKFKTHSLTVLTGAIKNTFGMIPGLIKMETHKRAPRPRSFAEAVVDFFSVVKPKLTIVDGIVAMDGNGPVQGNLLNMNIIVGGVDPVAVDTVLAEIGGIDGRLVRTTCSAVRRNLGVGDLADIEIRGESLRDVRTNFRVPSPGIFGILPEAVLQGMGRLLTVKPRVGKNLCTGCKICIASCPFDAIKTDGGKAVVQERNCKACLCCFEVCPKNAIYLKESFLKKVLSRRPR